VPCSNTDIEIPHHDTNQRSHYPFNLRPAESLQNDIGHRGQAAFELIKNTLEGGEDVLISGFGKFCVKNKGNRGGRNACTGGDLMLAEERIVTFKCSTVLKRKLIR
jgi:nucleoid DNA-binding protein